MTIGIMMLQPFLLVITHKTRYNNQIKLGGSYTEREGGGERAIEMMIEREREEISFMWKME